MPEEDTNDNYISTFKKVVDRNKAVLIIPAPSGYLLMNAPTKEEEDSPLENFAALSSAGDVIIFLMDLYGDWLIPAKTDDYYDSVYDLLDVGKVDPSPDKKKVSVKIQAPSSTETSGKIPQITEKASADEVAIGKKQPKEKNGTANTCKNIKGNGEKKKRQPKKAEGSNPIPSLSKKEVIGWMCEDCGATYETRTNKCRKCNSGAIDTLTKEIVPV